METSFQRYMAALAAAMRQELPDVSDARAEFMVDGIPYVFTAEEDTPSVFVYAVIGALPQDEEARAGVFAGLLHAQYCFSESSGFSFGVDEGDAEELVNSTFAEVVSSIDRAGPCGAHRRRSVSVVLKNGVCGNTPQIKDTVVH